MRKILTVLLLVSAVTPVVSQEGNLDWMLGEWDATYQYTNPDGSMAMREGTWTTSPTPAGSAVIDEMIEVRSDGSRSSTTVLRRPASRGWEGVTVSDGQGRGLVFRGEATSDDGFLGEGYAVGDPTTKFRIHITRNSTNRFTFILDISQDGGANWIEDVQIVTATRS